MKLNRFSKKSIVPALLALLATTAAPVLAQCEIGKIVASDGSAEDNFSWNMDIDGHTLIVGAPFQDHGQTMLGAAYIYRYDGVDWIEEARLEIDDPDPIGDGFGFDVAIQGEVAVAGSPGEPGNEHLTGVAYVFEHVDGAWIRQATLLPSDIELGDGFGLEVSLDNDTIVVSSGRDDDGAGSVYVFEKPGNGWTDMTETAKLTESDRAPGNEFAWTSIEGDLIVVGASHRLSDGLGCAYLFERPDGGWQTTSQETAKLSVSDVTPGDGIGERVRIDGNTVLVNANQFYRGGPGAAYVYEKPQAGWADMIETAKLTASDGADSDFFGRDLWIEDDLILIAAMKHDTVVNGVFHFNVGAAYLFERPGSGWVDMHETRKLVPSDGFTNEFFGVSTVIQGDTALVGAAYDNENGVRSGSAYVYADLRASGLSLTEPIPGVAGRVNRLSARCAAPGSEVYFVYGLRSGSTSIPGCPGLNVAINAPRMLGASVADAQGVATFEQWIPGSAAGRRILLQAIERNVCQLSNLVDYQFPN